MLTRSFSRSARRVCRTMVTLLLLFLLVSPGTPGSARPSAADDRAERAKPALIRLNGFEFDPLVGAPAIPPGLAHRRVDADRDYYIVQLLGPVTTGMKRDLEAAGASILYYVPDDGFIVAAREEALGSIRALPDVRWVGDYEPAFKLSPRLSLEYDAVVDAMDQRVGKSPVDTHSRITIQVLPMESSSIPELDRAVRARGASDVRTSMKGRGLVRAEVPRASLEALAHSPGVLWIDREVPDYAMNDVARWTIQSNAPLQAPIHDPHNLHGTGQIVTVADSGIDYEHNAFNDPQVATPGPTHRKVTAYYIPPNANGDTHDNTNNHGSHVAGTVAGDDGQWHVYDGDGVDSGNLALEESQPHDGQAFDATLQVQDISRDNEGGQVEPPQNYYDLFGPAVNAGSMIHTNSWGPSCCGEYDTNGMQTDDFVWGNPGFLVLFAAGNAGTLPGSLNPHAAAKNTIAVGASNKGGLANDLMDVPLARSGRGPTKDGRLKPDVIAPGQDIYSVRGCDPDPVCNNYRRTLGTSMATPMVAGAAALVRQYFMEGFYPTGQPVPANAFLNPPPSAALLKAVLINSAVEMTGLGTHVNGETGYPNINEGWGRILLENALYFQGDSRSLMVVDEWGGVATNETLTYQFGVSDSAEPLEVTLVWSDHSAVPAANIVLVNDLDLTVTAPDGTLYQGNTFSAPPGQSRPVPASGVVEPDRRNNVEGVILPAGLPIGPWTIQIRGQNVPMGAGAAGQQPFALVVTGRGPAKAGVVALERDRYTAGADVHLTVIDKDLDVNPGAPDTCSVSIQSETEPGGESVVLAETSASSGVFAGAIQALHGTSPVPGDGKLQVQSGNTIVASYLDADNGAGGSSTRTDTALVDEGAPAISSVAVTNLETTRATITWQTNETANSSVTFGLVAPPAIVASDASPTLSHSVTLTNLLPGSTYFFKVSSTDLAGNVATSDNGGAFYQLTTPVQLPSAASEWPAFHYDRERRGVSPTRFLLPLTLVWSSPPLQPNYLANGSTLAGGVLFTATSDGFVRARTASTGALLWQRQIGTTTPSQAQAPPSVAGGVAYVPSRTGQTGPLLALNVSDGSTLWETPAGSSYSATGAPVVDSGLVIASMSNSIVAHNPSNGSIVWSSEIFPDFIQGFAVGEGKVFVSMGASAASGSVAALNEATGQTIWTRTLPTSGGGAPTVGSGRVFVGTVNTVTDSGEMYALDTANGTIVWQRDGLGMVRETPAYDGVNLYFAAASPKHPARNRLYALRTSDGSSVWERLLVSRSVGSPALASGRLYDFTFDGMLRIFDATNGLPLSTIALTGFAVGQSAVSSPIASGGWVWVSDASGSVRALQGVLSDFDADGEPDDVDCAPANAAINHSATEAIPSLGGTLTACHDGVDNDCDGVVDLDCAIDLDVASQVVNPGVVTSGSVTDLRATSTQSPTTYEVLTEAGSANGKKLTAIWSVATPNYGLQTFDLVVEAFRNASANNDFTFSYVKKAIGQTCDSGWNASGPAITATSDTNTTQRAGIGTLASNLVCVRVQDTGSGSDSQPDPLTLDRVYLFPTPTCADGDGDGYTASCNNCYRPTCPALDCDDADAQKSPGVVEGPYGYPNCFDSKDNNCNGLIDAADLQACAPPPPSILASADVATNPGQVITPDFTLTQETDDVWEVFQETTEANKSKLTTTWRFDNVPSGSSHSLRLEAHRTNQGDTDFQFSWSTSPTTGFTDISGALINHPFENEGGQVYPFGAAGVSGTLYIRAKTAGTGTALDRLYVDFMVIQTTP